MGDAAVAQVGLAAALERFFAWSHSSFWGVFGWMGVWMDARIYTAALAFGVAVAAGGVSGVGRVQGMGRLQRAPRGASTRAGGGHGGHGRLQNARFQQPRGRIS